MPTEFEIILSDIVSKLSQLNKKIDDLGKQCELTQNEVVRHGKMLADLYAKSLESLKVYGIV